MLCYCSCFFFTSCNEKTIVKHKYPLVYKVIIKDEQNVLDLVGIATSTYFPEEDISLIRLTGKDKYKEFSHPSYLHQFDEWNDTLDMLVYPGCIYELVVTTVFNPNSDLKKSQYSIGDTLRCGQNTIEFVWPDDTLKKYVPPQNTKYKPI